MNSSEGKNLFNLVGFQKSTLNPLRLVDKETETMSTSKSIFTSWSDLLYQLMLFRVIFYNKSVWNNTIEQYSTILWKQTDMRVRPFCSNDSKKVNKFIFFPPDDGMECSISSMIIYLKRCGGVVASRLLKCGSRRENIYHRLHQFYI